jgi:hypothetical protein
VGQRHHALQVNRVGFLFPVPLGRLVARSRHLSHFFVWRRILSGRFLQTTPHGRDTGGPWTPVLCRSISFLLAVRTASQPSTSHLYKGNLGEADSGLFVLLIPEHERASVAADVPVSSPIPPENSTGSGSSAPSPSRWIWADIPPATPCDEAFCRWLAY